MVILVMIKNKSTIAKLLSEEDIHVVYKQMETAYFNPKSRELGLPIWDENKTTKDVEDLMVCHEIAHALWTPLDMLEQAQIRKINHSFVNIVEDARIERMVQEKYRGSVAVFNRGYRDLSALDFFGIGNKDVSKLNLIDRINLFFKKQDVKFSEEEKIWVKKVSETKTPTDVLDLAEALYKWMEENESETDNHDTGEEMGDSDSSGEKGESGDSDSSGEKSESSNNGNDEGEENGNDDNKSGSDESDADDAAEDGEGSGGDKVGDSAENNEETNSDTLEDSSPEGGVGTSGAGKAPIATTDTGHGIDLLRDKNAEDRIYGNIPDMSKLDIIVSYKELIIKFDKELKNFSSQTDNNYASTLSEVETIKVDSKKTVAYMVKEFEMKKSADAYARASTSKTGSLDMGKIYTYKFNDDIFKKVTTLPGATNHGMILVLDWSGSMADNLKGTLTQLFNLIWFCRNTRIPFEVFAFSDSYQKYQSGFKSELDNFKAGDLITKQMNLLNIFSSSMNVKEEMSMMHNCWLVASQYGPSVFNESFSKYIYPIHFPSYLGLGGTPLNEAIIAMMDIVPKFKKETGVQKVNTIFLTDGASNGTNWVNDYKFDEKNNTHEETCINLGRSYSFENGCYIRKDIILTDTKTRKSYTINSIDNGQLTNKLLEMLKARVDGMNLVGFFIAGSGKSGRVDKRVLADLLDKSPWEVMEEVKFVNKNKYLAITSSGYDEYYILPAGGLKVQNSGLDDDLVGASKAKLKSAFGKSMKNRVESRQLLNKFVKLVA
jgi:hypothetical protein